MSDPGTAGSTSQMEKELSTSAPPVPVDAADVTLGFGTLTIDVENRSRYIGPSGGAAYLNPELWKMNPSQTHSRRNSQDIGAPPFDGSGVRGPVNAHHLNLADFPSSYSNHQDSSMGKPFVQFNFKLTPNEVDGSQSPRASQLEAEILAKMDVLPVHAEAVRIARLYFKNVAFMQGVYSSFLLPA